VKPSPKAAAFLQALGEPSRIPAFHSNFSGLPWASAWLFIETMHWPKPIGSPVLESLPYAIESSRDVHTHYDKIVEVASWMAYEELPMPEFALPFALARAIQRCHRSHFGLRFHRYAFTNLTPTSNSSGLRRTALSDSDAEFACSSAPWIRRSILDATISPRSPRRTKQDLQANIEMPMLDESSPSSTRSAKSWRQIRRPFHNFVRSCSPKLYDNGNGLIDRLVKEFPLQRCQLLDGHEIKFYKLPQLGIWMLYATMHPPASSASRPER